MSTNTAEDALLQKLQSQFGDLDLSCVLANETLQQNNNENEDDESSSAAEPTPEELAAWQEQQFQKGKQQLELQKQLTMTPLQKRRELSKTIKQQQQQQQQQFEEDEWEQVAAMPKFCETSIFFPKLDDMGNEFLGIHPLLQQLVMEGDAEILGTDWKRLYSSAEGDGLSFAKLLHSIRGYPGPTITLFGTIPSANHSISKKDNQSVTLGFYTTSGWKESFEMFGSSDCFLFALDETLNKVRFFRPLDSKEKDQKHYMYCHPSSLSNKGKTATAGTTRRDATDGSVHGIGIGGTPNKPRLHITESMEDCRALSYCSKFEAGDLLLGNGEDSLYYFDIDCLEVWAVGGEEWILESLEEQHKGQAVAASTRLRARKVDKKQFMDDLRSGLLHPNKTSSLFDHVQHTIGRL